MNYSQIAKPAFGKGHGELSVAGLPTMFIVAFLPLSTPLSSACRCRSSQWEHPVCAMYASALVLFHGIVQEALALSIPDLLDLSFVSEAANHYYRVLVLCLIARAPPEPMLFQKIS